LVRRSWRSPCALPLARRPLPATATCSAAWSPDGRRVAFAALAADGGDSEIYVAAADGSNLRQLTENYLPDRMPTWSPDGRRIAFASARTGLFQIYSMRSDGSRQRRLTDQTEDCETPAWSPRGRWIVASCELGYWKLVLLRPDGSAEHRLLRGYPVTESSPSWTPDGQDPVLARRASSRGTRHLHRPARRHRPSPHPSGGRRSCRIPRWAVHRVHANARRGEPGAVRDAEQWDRRPAAHSHERRDRVEP
jgi:dipeptidyl aminopeptidase/acylaminoacyl peptidase